MKKERCFAIMCATFLVTIIVMSVPVLFAAQVPKAEKDIPIYSGAVRSMNEESVSKEQMGWASDPSLRSAELKLYKTGVSPEEVFGFYLQMIGGKEGVSQEDPMGIKPGATSQVWYEIEFYKDEEFEDYVMDVGCFGATAKHPGSWMKQNLTKNRKPYQPGKWIEQVCFNWTKKEANNDLTVFYLIIQDNSFEFAPEKYQTSSKIEVQVTTTKSEEAMREESDENMEREIETMSRSFESKPPTEKELGVPPYPQAKFDADNSAGMSAGNDYAMYIYLTSDPPSKVATFYEQQLKIKPVSVGDDQYMIPLKGTMPMPDEGISIQPNIMFGGSAKTVISIQKMIGARE